MLDEFLSARGRMLSMAYRMLGSMHDAEDVVQDVYLRARRVRAAEIGNPPGWLTTTTARLCLDRLRARGRREEIALQDEEIPDARLMPEEELLRRDELSRALLVVLSQLTPPQRVAFVLHDVFAVPFDDIGRVLGVSAAAAKKQASRARQRVRPEDPARAEDDIVHARLVQGFLEAAKGGDIGRLIELMAPDVLRNADPGLLPPGASATVRGAQEVARETGAFLDRIRMSVPVGIDGVPGAVIAPAGRPRIVIGFEVDSGRITRIVLRPYRGERLTPVD